MKKPITKLQIVITKKQRDAIEMLAQNSKRSLAEVARVLIAESLAARGIDAPNDVAAHGHRLKGALHRQYEAWLTSSGAFSPDHDPARHQDAQTTFKWWYKNIYTP